MPRPHSASLDIDDGVSETAPETARSSICFKWRKRRRRSPLPTQTSSVLVRTLFGTLAATAAYTGHNTFKRSDLYGVADRSQWRSCAGYDKRDFLGVSVATVGFPVAWICFVGAGSAAARLDRWALPTLALLAAGALATVALASRDAAGVLRCGVLWCDAATEGSSSYATTVALLLFAGGWTAFFLFAGLAYRVFQRRSKPATPLTEPLLDDAEAAVEPESLASTALSAFGTIAWTALLLVVLAGLLLLTAVLPNSWQGFTAAGIATYQRTGPGAMVDAWTKAAPEGQEAWLRTGFFRLNARLVLKVYPDVAMYYGFLAVLALVACAGRVSARIAKLLRRRLRVVYRLWSVGELLVVSLFALLLVGFGRYAFFDHAYASDPSKSRWEVLARGTGQLANLGLALLLLPVARRSVIAEAFGLAWEQLLWAHIWVGYATLLLFVVHGACWFKVYDSLHVFPEDILEVPMYYPTNGQPKSAGRCSDDWTVPLATLTTIGALLFLGVLSHHQIRRRHFELFYYAHHFFVAVYVVALWRVSRCPLFALGPRRWRLHAIAALISIAQARGELLVLGRRESCARRRRSDVTVARGRAPVARRRADAALR